MFLSYAQAYCLVLWRGRDSKKSQYVKFENIWAKKCNAIPKFEII